MLMKRGFFIDRDDGKIYRVTPPVYEEINLLDNIIPTLCQDMAISVLNAAQVGQYGKASLSLAKNDEYWTLPITKLPLCCPWMTSDGKVFPNLTSRTDPVYTLQWEPPPAMKLVTVHNVLTAENKTKYVAHCYMFAVQVIADSKPK